LLFLCLSVASAVFFTPLPTSASGTGTEVLITNELVSCSEHASTTSFIGIKNPEYNSIPPDDAILPNNSTIWEYWNGLGCPSTGDNIGYYDLSDFMSTTTSGVYLMIFGDNQFGDMIEPWFYGQFYWNATTSEISNVLNYSTSTLDSSYYSGFHSTYDTKFTDVSASTTAGHLDDLYVSHFVDPDEVDTNLSARNPTYIKLSYAKQPDIETASVFETLSNLSGSSTGNGVTEFDLSSLTHGTYDVLIQFSNIGANLGLSEQPFPDAYVYLTIDLDPATGLSIVGDVEYYDKTTLPEPDIYEDCSLGDLTCHLSNAGKALFLPSQESVANFITLQESISGKFPFNYVSDFKDAFASLYTTSATQSLTISVPFGSFGNITLLSADLINAVPFASTIRTILSYLLWIMLTVQIYRRTLRIFNSQETTA